MEFNIWQTISLANQRLTGCWKSKIIGGAGGDSARKLRLTGGPGVEKNNYPEQIPEIGEKYSLWGNGCCAVGGIQRLYKKMIPIFSILNKMLLQSWYSWSRSTLKIPQFLQKYLEYNYGNTLEKYLESELLLKNTSDSKFYPLKILLAPCQFTWHGESPLWVWTQ